MPILVGSSGSPCPNRYSTTSTSSLLAPRPRYSKEQRHTRIGGDELKLFQHGVKVVHNSTLGLLGSDGFG